MFHRIGACQKEEQEYFPLLKQTTREFTMDRADRALLGALQANSSRSIAELAALVNLAVCLPSPYPCAGGAGPDPGICRKGGCQAARACRGSLRGDHADQPDPRSDGTLRTRGGDFEDILECHLMSGAADYQLRVAAADLDHYDRIHRDCLARLPGFPRCGPASRCGGSSASKAMRCPDRRRCPIAFSERRAGPG